MTTRNVNTRVNTTQAGEEDGDSRRKKMETLEQGVENMRRVFKEARRMDIRIAAIDGADRLGNVLEGGVNGYMFALQRGVDIPDVPEPIVEVLRNAGIEFSALSPWKGGSQE